jgi:outer membrane immunogenic protein
VIRRSVVAWFGLLAAGLAGVGAQAADLPPRYAPMVPQAPIYSPLYNWTGFYVGINGGGGWGRSQWDGIDKFGPSGGLIGGTLGYNWQVGGRWVVGVEGDVDWSGIRATTTVLPCALGCETRNHWLATARGRAGYAWDRFLPYLTAGLALGDVSASRPGFPAGNSTTAGWTVGAGLEFGVVGNVSLKAEYLLVSLSDFNCGFNCGLAANGNITFYANIFRGGLNVHF